MVGSVHHERILQDTYYNVIFLVLLMPIAYTIVRRLGFNARL